MKCPCCGGESDQEFLLHANRLYWRGHRIAIQPLVGAFFRALLLDVDHLGVRFHNGPKRSTAHEYHSAVNSIQKIRKLLAAYKFPFRLTRISRGVYALIPTETSAHGQARNHPSERPKNVHS